MWITNGGFADLFTIFAKVNGDQFTAFLVERGMVWSAAATRSSSVSTARRPPR
jgi:alkylation response protein AidB-like acyl-CoA dehydrogenase